jgi:2,4-dienoyl-CoA reductase-like NADH-dependent reductase (Old Yellow Enzyme family)
MINNIIVATDPERLMDMSDTYLTIPTRFVDMDGEKFAYLVEGKADLFAFGRLFISNPDLVERLEIDAPLAALDLATLYGRGAKGYIDYPTFADSNVQ